MRLYSVKLWLHYGILDSIMKFNAITLSKIYTYFFKINWINTENSLVSRDTFETVTWRLKYVNVFYMNTFRFLHETKEEEEKEVEKCENWKCRINFNANKIT